MGLAVSSITRRQCPAPRESRARMGGVKISAQQLQLPSATSVCCPLFGVHHSLFHGISLCRAERFLVSFLGKFGPLESRHFRRGPCGVCQLKFDRCGAADSSLSGSSAGPQEQARRGMIGAGWLSRSRYHVPDLFSLKLPKSESPSLIQLRLLVQHSSESAIRPAAA